MCQDDIERFAFLYLCGSRDKALLSGEERMTFSDFDRLFYITEYLGLSHMNLEIWNRFSPDFQERLEGLSRLAGQDYEDEEQGEYDTLEIQDEWLAGFCATAPEGTAREYLCRLMGMEEETDENRQTDTR